MKRGSILIDKFFPLYALVFLLTLSVTVILEKRLIPAFKKRAKQPIYSEGPKWHEEKSGTPTFGGIGFLCAVLISSALSIPILIKFKGGEAALSFSITIAYAAANAIVGILDDLKKVYKKKNKGLSATEKLVFQFFLALLFLLSRHLLLGDDTRISFSFGEIELGAFYYVFSVIILLGIVNCANLTDGIDGLASSVSFSIGISLLYISAALFEDVALIASALIGASVGFLVFNLHPAKIFMGDTGSLFFGAIVAASAISLGNPFISVAVGGVYVIEGVSVILQVVFFKITRGKRIFKMAPIHHHLEKCGWSENKICIVAILLTFIFSVPAYIFYLPYR